ncbi:MAG: AraC family transcriptional regulator [Kiritimatiellae bacterium]|nr:AraC family transcriptional regulator [Kiritimatiellia bacterium]
MPAYHTQVCPGLLNREVYRDLSISNAGYYEHARGHRCRRETVKEYQIAYCVEGGGAIQCRGRTVAVRKGGVFINIPGYPHEYWADEARPWTLWWVHFVGESAARYFSLMRCRPAEPAFHVGMNERLVDLFKEMLQELSRPERHHQVAAVSYLHLILSSVACLRRQPLLHAGGGRVKKRIDMPSLNAYIEAHLPELSLTRLARFAGVSVPHFERLFKVSTGYSPMEFVIRRRIALACRRLFAKPDATIKEVASEVGYEDQHYFSRVFKRVTGFPPAHYRRLYG